MQDQDQCWLRHHWNDSCTPDELNTSHEKGGWLERWLGELPEPLWGNRSRGDEAYGEARSWEGPHLVERCCAQFLVSR